jgi:hypothetical protein
MFSSDLQLMQYVSQRLIISLSGSIIDQLCSENKSLENYGNYSTKAICYCISRQR